MIAGAANGRGSVDLSENIRFTFALIETPWRWRHRLVETLELESATDLRATSAYQIEFPPELLEEFSVGDAERANVVLPVTTKEKRPLLRFNISTSHGSPAHLLNRRSNSAIEAQYVRSLAEAGPTAADALGGLSDELLEAMFVVTPGLYEQIVKEHGRIDGIRTYLQSGIGLTATREDVAPWLEELQAASALLLAALNEPADPLSSSENILIALPELQNAPTTVAEVDVLVASYVAAIRAACEAGDAELLSAIGEYGRRWEMLVEVEVPLFRPTEITIAEDRPLQLGRGGWVAQRVALGDALSAHIQVRVPDPAIEIQEDPEGGWRVEALDGAALGLESGSPLGLGIFETVRLTRDTLAVYTAVLERPFFVRVAFRIRAAAYIRWTNYIATAITLAAASGAIVITSTHDLMERLGVLAIPTSVGAAVVLIREQSGLAIRLNRWSRLGLMLALTFLWVVLFVRVLDEGVRFHRHHPAGGGLTTTTTTTRSALGGTNTTQVEPVRTASGGK